MGLTENDFYFPKEKSYTIRLLSAKNKGPFYFAMRIHNVGNKTYHCTKTVKEPSIWHGSCVICEHYGRFYQFGQPQFYPGKDFDCDLRMIKPIERFFYNVIVRGQEKLGPKVWKCGKALHQQIVTSIVGDQSKGTRPLGDVTNPETGRDLSVEVEQKIVGGGQSFPMASGTFMPSSRLGTVAQIAQWVEQLHDLNQIFTPPVESEMLDELESIFGHLGKIKSYNKRTFRAITEPFKASW